MSPVEWSSNDARVEQRCNLTYIRASFQIKGLSCTEKTPDTRLAQPLVMYSSRSFTTLSGGRPSSHHTHISLYSSLTSRPQLILDSTSQNHRSATIPILIGRATNLGIRFPNSWYCWSFNCSLACLVHDLSIRPKFEFEPDPIAVFWLQRTILTPLVLAKIRRLVSIAAFLTTVAVRTHRCH